MIKSVKILDFCFECNLAAIGQKKNSLSPSIETVSFQLAKDKKLLFD